MNRMDKFNINASLKMNSISYFVRPLSAKYETPDDKLHNSANTIMSADVMPPATVPQVKDEKLGDERCVVDWINTESDKAGYCFNWTTNSTDTCDTSHILVSGLEVAEV